MLWIHTRQNTGIKNVLQDKKSHLKEACGFFCTIAEEWEKSVNEDNLRDSCTKHATIAWNDCTIQLYIIIIHSSLQSCFSLYKVNTCTAHAPSWNTSHYPPPFPMANAYSQTHLRRPSLGPKNHGSGLSYEGQCLTGKNNAEFNIWVGPEQWSVWTGGHNARVTQPR